MRVAIYCRVSTEEQAKKENSIPMQEKKCREYVQKQEGWIVEEVFADGGYTGAHINRPALQQMLDKIENREIDVVLVWRLDRLSRDIADTVNLVKEWKNKNCQFSSATEPFSTTDLYGEQMLYVLAMIAQYERGVTAERVRNVLRNKASKGEWAGGIPPYGYRRHEKDLIINEEEAAIVKSIFELYLEGHGYLKISKILNELGIPSATGIKWSHASVKRILLNPVYAGQVIYGIVRKKYINGKLKALKPDDEPVIAYNENLVIIDNDTFNSVQELQKKRSKRHGFTKTSNKTHLLSGVLRCSCGQKMYSAASKPHKYYRCATQRYGGGSCEMKSIRQEEVDEQVYRFIQKSLTREYINSISIEKTDNKEKQINFLKKQISEKEKIINNLFGALGRGVINDDDFVIQRKSAQEDIENHKIQLEQLRNDRHKKDEYVETCEKLLGLAKKPFENIKPDNIPLLRGLINEVVELQLTPENELIIKFAKV